MLIRLCIKAAAAPLDRPVGLCCGRGPLASSNAFGGESLAASGSECSAPTVILPQYHAEHVRSWLAVACHLHGLVRSVSMPHEPLSFGGDTETRVGISDRI